MKPQYMIDELEELLSDLKDAPYSLRLFAIKGALTHLGAASDRTDSDDATRADAIHDQLLTEVIKNRKQVEQELAKRQESHNDTPDVVLLDLVATSEMREALEEAIFKSELVTLAKEGFATPDELEEIINSAFNEEWAPALIKHIQPKLRVIRLNPGQLIRLS